MMVNDEYLYWLMMVFFSVDGGVGLLQVMDVGFIGSDG